MKKWLERNTALLMVVLTAIVGLCDWYAHGVSPTTSIVVLIAGLWFRIWILDRMIDDLCDFLDRISRRET